MIHIVLLNKKSQKYETPNNWFPRATLWNIFKKQISKDDELQLNGKQNSTKENKIKKDKTNTEESSNWIQSLY